MDEQEKMKNSLLRNLNWFLNSGVMIPESGIWGVAERVAVTNGNEASHEKIIPGMDAV